MGRMIEGIALERGHNVVCRIDKDNLGDFDSAAFREADVAIEFTAPTSARDNLLRCFAAGVPAVCGSTGWTADLPAMKELCDRGEGTLLWASNFSVGVNVFMAVNRYLARIMDNLPQYAPSMVETHHVHKLDHPSGTAITLASQLAECVERVAGWSEEPEQGKITISHIREGEVPGIHTIKWDSPVDEISISHSAKSRAGFALGAVMAAEWLAGRKGWHTIDEVMAELIK